MTREIPLSRGMVALVDDGDFDDIVAAGPWHAVPGQRTYYARHSFRQDGKPRTVAMHILIAGVAGVDHVNGNGLDNRRANLRPASTAQNAANRPPRSDSTSGYKGVLANRHRGKPWRAQIHANGSKHHLGLYDTPEEAARAYDAAASTFFGDFAYLNFPMEKSA